MAIRDYRPETRAPEGTGTPELSLERAGSARGAEALGGALADFGTILENARQETEANDARLRMTEELGAISTELEADTDHGTMQARYGERLSKMSSEIMGGLSTPRLKSQLGLEIARAKVAGEARVFTRQRELAGSAARATLSSQLRASANAIPNAATDQEADATYERAMASIASLEAAGHLDPERAEAMRQGFDGSVAEASVLASINDDAAVAVAALSQEGAFGLDEAPRQQYLARATRIAEQEADQKRAKVDRRLATAKDVLVRGGTVNPDDLATLQADVAGTDDAAELAGAVAASERLGGFASQPPDMRAAEIERVRAQGVDLEESSTDAAELRALEAMDEAARAAVARDPVAYAISLGWEGAAPLDLGDPKSVEDRMALVSYMAARHGAPRRVFSDEERVRFKDTINGGSTQDQLAVVTTLIDGFGPGADAAFAELDGLKPAVRMAGELVLDTGETDVAATLLAGQKAIEQGDEARIPNADALYVFSDVLDGVVGQVPGRRERVIAAAKAYYAALAPERGIGPDDVDEQTALLGEGIAKALGSVTRGEGEYGGIQSVNGMRVKLPPTLDAAATETVLGARDADVWRQGSLSGALPRWGMGNSDAWEETVPDDAQLKWVSGSIYVVGRTSRRGGFERFRDPGVEDGYFYVDLSKMAEAHLRRATGTARRAPPPGPAMPPPGVAGAGPARNR